MADAARHGLAVTLDSVTLTPADVSIWDSAEGQVEDHMVPLEFYFAGAPATLDEQGFASALASTIEAYFQEQRRAEFRAQLNKRKDATLRRRSSGQTAAVEGGDATEESWREYVKRPAVDSKLKVHSVFEAGNRVRRVLACRVSLAPQAADELGHLCFRHIFEPEDSDAPLKKWYEDPFLSCFYPCFCIILSIFLLWAFLLLRAIFQK